MPPQILNERMQLPTESTVENFQLPVQRGPKSIITYPGWIQFQLIVTHPRSHRLQKLRNDLDNIISLVCGQKYTIEGHQHIGDASSWTVELSHPAACQVEQRREGEEWQYSTDVISEGKQKWREDLKWKNRSEIGSKQGWDKLVLARYKQSVEIAEPALKSIFKLQYLVKVKFCQNQRRLLPEAGKESIVLT